MVVKLTVEGLMVLLLGLQLNGGVIKFYCFIIVLSFDFVVKRRTPRSSLLVYVVCCGPEITNCLQSPIKIKWQFWN